MLFSYLGKRDDLSLRCNHNPLLKRYCKARHIFGTSLDNSHTNENCSRNNKYLSMPLDSTSDVESQSSKEQAMKESCARKYAQESRILEQCASVSLLSA